MGSERCATSTAVRWPLRVIAVLGLMAGAVLLVTRPALGLDCTIVWDGGGGTVSWHTAANWDTDTVPSSSDWVCIPAAAPGSSVVFSTGITSILGLEATKPFTISGGTLTLTDTLVGSSIQELSQSGGVFGGAATVTIPAGGSFTWSSGTHLHPGTTIVESGASLSLTSSFDKLLQRRMQVSGTTSFSGGRLLIATNSGQPTTELIFDGDVTMSGDRDIVYHYGSVPVVTSSAAFTKTSGTGTTTISTAFANAGTMTIQTGTLRLGRNGAHAGDFVIPSGATLDLGGGTHTFSAASSITGAGSGVFSGATVVLDGAYDLPKTTVAGGVLNANGSFDTSTLSVTAGTFNLGAPDAVETMSQSGGVVGGAATLTVPAGGSFVWSGGTQLHPGVTVVEPGASLSMTGSFDKLLQRRMQVGGTTTFSGGRLLMATNSGQPATHLIIDGDLEMIGDRDIVYHYGSVPVLTSSGVFEKTSGSGTTTITVPFNNAGTVGFGTGTLRLLRGGSQTGAFVIPAGATLDLGGGTHAFSGESSITGGGTGRISGATVVLDGAYHLPVTMVTAGVLNAGGAFDTSTLTVTAGTFNLGVPAAIQTVSQSGGVVGGAGTLTVPVGGSFVWSAGTQVHPGVTIVEPGASLSLTGGFDKLLQRRMQVGGTTTFSGGRLLIATNSGQPTTELLFDGDVTMLGDRDITYYFGSVPLVTSAAAFTKVSGTGTATISVVFLNAGTVTVQSGTLNTTRLANYNSSTRTITGGAFHLYGALKIPFADILTNRSSITLDGLASGLVDHNNVNGLRNLATNATDGSLILANGRSLGTSGPITNDGAVALGASSSLTANGHYRQTGGTTSLLAADARLTALDAVVDIQGGTLDGIGTVGPALSNPSGFVAPGAPTGTISVEGAYSQGPAGSLAVEIGAAHDALAVAGGAGLAGTLLVTTEDGFVPAVGDRFPILTHTGLTGAFAAAEGLEIADGLFYRLEYGANDVALVVYGASQLDAYPVVASADTAEPGGDVYLALSAKLTSSDGSPIAGKTISFSVGASEVCTAVTDADGVATCSDPVAVARATLAQGYLATFAGDDEYLRATSGASLAVIDGAPVP